MEEEQRTYLVHTYRYDRQQKAISGWVPAGTLLISADMLLLSSDLSHVDSDLLLSPSLNEGGLLPSVTIRSFCLCMNDHVVPTDGAKC